MTQMLHWLAALALFLVSHPGVVHVEKGEEEVAPPARASAEVLPAPKLVTKAACCQACGSSCACCSQCCAQKKGTEPAQCVVATGLDANQLIAAQLAAKSTQYVVATRFVDASPDGDCEEMMSPKLTVLDGQTANVVVQGEETPTERRAVGLQVRLTKQGDGLHLDMGVEKHIEWNHTTAGQASMMTAACHMGCNVTLGKTKRLVLSKHAVNGADASWVEVTVTAISPEQDEDESPLDYVGDVVEDLIDTVSDVATTLFGDDAEVQQAAFPTPTAAAPLAFPVQAVAPCPMCKQCVAVEAAQKTARQKCVEFHDGDKGWKATADRMTVRDGYLVMQGHVKVVSSDGSDEMTSEKLSLKMVNLEIQIGD